MLFCLGERVAFTILSIGLALRRKGLRSRAVYSREIGTLRYSTFVCTRTRARGLGPALGGAGSEEGEASEMFLGCMAVMRIRKPALSSRCYFTSAVHLILLLSFHFHATVLYCATRLVLLLMPVYEYEVSTLRMSAAQSPGPEHA